MADNGQTTRFLYAAGGTRANKAGPHGETIYVNRWFSIRNGAIVSKHVFADDVRLATKVSPDPNPPSEKVYFYQGDSLGSTQFVTDDQGTVYQHLEYFPSGEIWVDERSETQRTPYLFSAKELDEETGLSYFGARYYDARQGQWISADPILGGVLDTGSLRIAKLPETPFRLPGLPYAYAGNDPANLVDPTGLMPQGKGTKRKLESDSSDDGGGGIGGRVSKRNKSASAKSPRLKERAEQGRTARYVDVKRKGGWNGKSRPGWYDSTWDSLWAEGGNLADGSGTRQFVCVTCDESVYRQVDKPKQKRALDATIDHVIQFETYVRDNAEPDEDGNISSKAAQDASNHVKNLQIMCRSCNSKKNGKRNTFD